ncbi:hypothetical protein DXG01_006900 [Tephrocybe rancida]|nr:hypothetical protein DXG01_006900 [Tephrocybe rancida]
MTERLPLEIAKGVLASISGILGIVKNTFANQDDFESLAEQCQMIGLVIWRATSGPTEREISSTTLRALAELKSSVDGIRNAVEEKIKKNVGSKVFNVTINQETILQWKNELDGFLTLFNTELNISANLKLDELLASFQEFRAGVTSNLQPTVQVPDELPVRPKIFVGRDDLVKNTVLSLVGCQHVALIGPGGMGKSSIARAVLNDEALSVKFQERRFFVRFDDLDPAQITFGTFLDRVGRAMAISTLANIHSLITKALSTSETLLVLDNAETFLDAAVDAGRIADAIDGFGARSNVAILLTTRTSVLPPNLQWVRLRVPALEENPACEAFKLLYTPSIESSTLIKLLAAVDFHPLSINLLAQAAVQNEWSPEHLVDAWDRQRSVLLEVGDGKIQSIAVTIETSLNSPSVLKLGDTIRQLLQIIAFLPQGVDKRRLTDMFPGISDIESCAEALCKQSLAYLNGEFITLLAPIRLYMAKRYNTNIVNNPLLEKVQSYYKAHVIDEEIVAQDDVNIEHVFTRWVGDPAAMKEVFRLIARFLFTLFDCRPRPVALFPVIRALNPEKSTSSVSCMESLMLFPKSKSVAVSVEKGYCLFAISTLMRWIGQILEAEAVLAEARTLLLEAGRVGRSQLLFIDWVVASVYSGQGHYKAAEELSHSALKRSSTMFRPDPAVVTYLRLELTRARMLRGTPGTSKDILKAARSRSIEKNPAIKSFAWFIAGFAEINDGHLDLAKQYFQEAQTQAAADKELGQPFAMALGGLVDVAVRQGNQVESKALRTQALGLIHQMPDETIPFVSEAIALVAGYLSMEGDVEQARKLVGPAVVNALKHMSGPAVVSTYLAGCVELIGGDLAKAGDYFRQTVENCILVAEVIFRARSERALGEIAVVKKDFKAARTHFEATTELCVTIGIPADCLYREFTCYMLSETFDGWKLYQEGHPMFRT